MLDQALAKMIGPLLDRLGKGWKTAGGLLALLIVQVLALTAVIEPETANTLETIAVALFGVGLYHAKISGQATGNRQ